MKSQNLISLAFLTYFYLGTAFQSKLPFSNSKYHQIAKISQPSTRPRVALNVAQPTESSDEIIAPKPSLTIQEFFMSPLADGRSITATLIGQSFLVGITLISSFFITHDIGIEFIKFDLPSMKTAGFVALPLIIGGLIFDNLPWKVSKEISQDTRIFSLRLLGRESSIISSLFLSMFLAATAGFSEELFFRGLVFNSIDNASNTPIALILSSVIFGFAHYPLWGANALVEAVLGGIFGYAYWFSDYNLAVPIAIHTMYDFATLFITWYFAKNDVNDKIFQAIKKEIRKMKDMTPTEVDKLSATVFDILDLNKDGEIDRKEFDTGLRLYGYGLLPFSTRRATGDIFDRTDKNQDGKIDLREFKQVVREDLKELGNKNI